MYSLPALLRYGIPDFKLEKWVVDRRLDIMEQEGVRFKTGAHVGININPEELQERFDAIVLCTGATVARDLDIPGRELNGVHYAMDFLTPQNKVVAGDDPEQAGSISAKDKHVLVIGGGDTGSDCIGTSHRHGAASVTQIELLVQPAPERTQKDPWPMWPMSMRTSSSHEEGGERGWSLLTKAFIGDDEGNLKGAKVVEIEWFNDESGRQSFREIEGTERTIPCELALLAIGFASAEPGLPGQFGLDKDNRGNIKVKKYRTSVDKIFAAGDARRGQSLVVWAISEGREAAYEVDKYLQGSSNLERKNSSYAKVKA
ncbi:MAG: glutamate synthase subunit beta [Cyclobacteriaceae bacterium]